MYRRSNWGTGARQVGREQGVVKETPQLLPNHPVTRQSSQTSRQRKVLEQITDGQPWQQSQKGSAAPTQGHSSSPRSPAASVTHRHCPNGLWWHCQPPDCPFPPPAVQDQDKSCLDSMEKLLKDHLTLHTISRLNTDPQC